MTNNDHDHLGHINMFLRGLDEIGMKREAGHFLVRPAHTHTRSTVMISNKKEKKQYLNKQKKRNIFNYFSAIHV